MLISCDYLYTFQETSCSRQFVVTKKIQSIPKAKPLTVHIIVCILCIQPNVLPKARQLAPSNHQKTNACCTARSSARLGPNTKVGNVGPHKHDMEKHFPVQGQCKTSTTQLVLNCCKYVLFNKYIAYIHYCIVLSH